MITTEKDFLKLCEKLSKAKQFVFDTETTSENPMEAKLVGVSFCLKEREAYYVAVEFIPSQEGDSEAEIGDLFSSKKKVVSSQKSVDKNQKLFQTQITIDVLTKHLTPIFTNEKILKIAQNAKYDAHVLANYGIEMKGTMHDTMIAHFVFKNNSRHGLDAMALEFLNYKMISFSELIGTGRDKKNIWEIPLEKISEYSCEDADMTLRLYNVMKEKMPQRDAFGRKEKQWSVCEDVDFPLINVLLKMERAGQKIDAKFLKDLSKELELSIQNAERDIYKLAGEYFNIQSNKQLQDILFVDRKSTRLNSSHVSESRMPSSA